MTDKPIDPVCMLHGKHWSEHELGRCLYCGICFTELTPETCWQDLNGDKWDICVPCHEEEESIVNRFTAP